MQEYDKEKSKAHIIVRAKSNRVLDCGDEESEKKLWEKLMAQAVVGQIKLYFKTLKSGCNIEKLQLENINRL